MTQTGSGHAAAESHGAGGVAEAMQENGGRRRVDEAARGQHKQQQQLQQQQQNEGVGWQEDRDRRMLESLVHSLLRVLEGPSGITPSEAASPSAELPLHLAGNAAEHTEEHDTAGVDREWSRKVDATTCQQQQQQQQQPRKRSTPSTSADVGAIRVGQQPPTSATAAATARSIVLTSTDLLLHIITYVQEGEPRRRVRELSERRVRQLGMLSLVCCAWRDAAQHESLWEPVAKAFVPRLADVQNATTTQAELRKAGGSYRRYLVEYARVLSEGYLMGSHWYCRIVLQCEIWTGPSGHYLFSGDSPMVGSKGTHGDYILGYQGFDAQGLEGGPYFSAASRSRPNRQYGNIREYLEDLGTVWVRMTVHETVTGRRGVLVNQEDLKVDEVSTGLHGDYHVVCDARPLTAVSGGSVKFDVAVCFEVCRGGETTHSLMTRKDMMSLLI